MRVMVVLLIQPAHVSRPLLHKTPVHSTTQTLREGKRSRVSVHAKGVKEEGALLLDSSQLERLRSLRVARRS